jgi:hypothetical protein
MATIFCDARNGSDANSGLTSFANAKKTLTASLIAAGNSGIVEAVGVFKETVIQQFFTNQRINGNGFCIIDGDGVLATGLDIAFARSLFVTGVIFKNHTTQGVRCIVNNQTYTFDDCVFEDEVIGIDHGANTSQMIFTRCIIRDCTTGYDGSLTGITASRTRFLNCTIVGCGTGVKMVSTVGHDLEVQNSILSHNTIHIDIDDAARITAGVTEFNCIDFASGKCVINSVDKLTLSAWQTDVSPKDARTISVDPLYVDRLKRLHGLKASSVCLKAGTVAFGTSVQGAILKPCEGVSTNENGGEWNNPTDLVDVIINGNGDLELDVGATVGTATIVHDFGVGRDISTLFVEHDDDFPSAVLDFDETDTLPETWEVRVATSDDNITFSAFTEVDLMRPDLTIVSKRYLKVELTLRRDL